jgi:hypothetical protein
MLERDNFQKERKIFNSNAGTRAPLADHRILSPVRLLIPASRQGFENLKKVDPLKIIHI